MRLAAVCLGIVAAAAIASAGSRDAAVPTFYGQVDRILRKHCDSCHHEGDVGPHAFDDAQTAHEWADGILEEIDKGAMPPWRPTRGVGRFLGEAGLTAKELDTLRRWRDAGAPIGTPPERPRPVAYESGWTLGEPDAVLDYGEAFDVPPDGDDIYRCFPVKNPFGRDVWISAMDVRPGDRRVVHHVVMYLDADGEAAALDAAEPGPGYTCFGGPATMSPMVLGGWAPGNRARFFPRGVAMRLGRNDTVVLQCHYHSHDTDVATPDRTTIGLYLSDDPNPTPMFLIPILNDTFTIPAGDTAYPVETVLDPAELTGGLIDVSGHVLAVLPHMHLLGREISVDLLFEDGTEQRLVEIPDWDFNWQATYTLKRPAAVTGGTKIRLHSVFDNSAANPRNPNSPPIPVSWGERTVDEMCLAFLAVTLGPAELDSPPAVVSAQQDADGNLVVVARRLGRGGRIEIAGVPLEDSASLGANRLGSAAAWRALAPGQGAVPLRVRRADGRLSKPFSFTR